jgi:hypothetical protein
LDSLSRSDDPLLLSFGLHAVEFLFALVTGSHGYGGIPSRGFAVLSEASIVQHTASSRMFAVGWLNLPNGRWTANRSDPITTRLSKTFDKYLPSTP